jgi:transposase
MRKNTIGEARPKDRGVVKATKAHIRKRAAQERLTIGLDLGDRNSSYCVLSEQGEILLENTLPTTKAGLGQVLEGMARCRVALEVGTHSPWVSRYVSTLGHEVIVANTRELAYITKSSRKDDRIDARKLARLARVDPELLSPIRHRSEAAHADLLVLRARDGLVRCRTHLICSVRGMVKSQGERLKKCDAENVGPVLVESMSEAIRRFAVPVLEEIESLNTRIAAYDREIATMEKRYPEVAILQQVFGVGALISLALVLTVEDPKRFRHSRDIGPYLGLRPKRRDSGASQPELGISKEGDKFLRRLLVQGAHTILRRGSPDSDLKRWGLAVLAQQDGKKKVGKTKKKKVVVAVARKLAVLLHHLWATGEVYDPLLNSGRVERAAA